MELLYRGHRFPPEIISRAVWLYHRFTLSFRDVEDLLAERGILVSYEAIRYWCLKFGPSSPWQKSSRHSTVPASRRTALRFGHILAVCSRIAPCPAGAGTVSVLAGLSPRTARYARSLRRKQGRLGDIWHVDELFITIRGQRYYLWRAVDQDGDVIDILVTRRRDRRAAKRFFRKMLKHQGQTPWQLITDKLRSYSSAHREVFPSVVHRTGHHENNRAEVSHQHTRDQERQMRRFKSMAQAQLFLSVHGPIQNLFRVGRHHLGSINHRILRCRAFTEWREATCVS